MSIKQQILKRVRIFNKYVTNRLTYRLAYASRGPFALVRHVGRRSGRHYETPIFAFPSAEVFVIALTYGPDVDWLYNVRAAGRCELVFHGKTYAIEQIESIDVESGMRVFAPVFRFILRRMGVVDYLRMSSSHTPSGAAQV